MALEWDPKQMRLEEVTKEEFKRMVTFWDKNVQNFYPTDLHTRIGHPIRWKVNWNTRKHDYKMFFHFLLSNPYTDQLKVNDEGSWEKRKMNVMSLDKLEEMAEIAATDRRKKNYMELVLKKDHTARDQSVIGFRHSHGEILAYEVRIHISQRELFRIIPGRNLRGYEFIKGLWVPGKAYRQYCQGHPIHKH